MYCSKHNTASYRSATCKVCDLENLITRLAELLQAYREGKASALVVYETSIALAKANEYGLIRNRQFPIDICQNGSILSENDAEARKWRKQNE